MPARKTRPKTKSIPRGSPDHPEAPDPRATQPKRHTGGWDEYDDRELGAGE